MSMTHERPDSLVELHRELNALCRLVHFARERCYPTALVARLEHLLTETAAAAARERDTVDAAA